MKRQGWVAIAALVVTSVSASAAPAAYKHFKVTVYIPVQVVNRMAQDPAWMKSSWETISSRLHVDKVFIESYRSGVTTNGASLAFVKKFFDSQGVETAGGMALLGPGGFGQFHTLDYANPKDRALLARMSALTARHFNEFILDDLYFYNTKSDADIAAKGKRTWTEYRLATMDEVSRDLILNPARAANPQVHVIIKFPNFYPSFQGMGFDLAVEPKIFGEIWTGDETRDPIVTDQQLQPYESYEIFRYFENIAPGHNGGGWVDPYAVRYLDRYAEQLWDTILAKAPAINLFQYSDLLENAEPGDREAWQTLPTSFNYFAMLRECCGFPGMPGAKPPLMADVAAYSLRTVDRVAGTLGQPVGLASYRPYQSHGEDFLRDVAGMMGIPIETYPTWPERKTVLLTETAKYDPHIVSEIAQRLHAGDTVIITSGLLRAIQDRGMNQITDMRVTHDILAPTLYVQGFGFGAGTIIGRSKPILYPEIHFYTNEDWAILRGIAAGRGVPILLTDHYSKGTLIVWNIPENMNDLYRLPTTVLDALRSELAGGLPARLEGPAQVSLFEYDNGASVIESYRNRPVTVRLICGFDHLQNVATGVTLTGEPLAAFGGFFGRMGRGPARPQFFGYELQIQPHSFEAFQGQK